MGGDGAEKACDRTMSEEVCKFSPNWSLHWILCHVLYFKLQVASNESERQDPAETYFQQENT
jgi:hypothetical protein